MKKHFLIFLFFFLVNTTLQSQVSCNSWLYTPTQPSYVDIGDVAITGNQLTIEALINRTSFYSNGVLTSADVVSKHSGPLDANYALRTDHGLITTTNGFFVTPSVSCKIDSNKTYHVAMVYDGSLLKFYRNGFLLSSIAATGNLIQNNLKTYIGFLNSQNLNENFIGYLNEVRIWNVARTQGEIKTFMNANLPNPSMQTGLMAYYMFDNLLNKQGNAIFNGTLGGSASTNNMNPQCSFIADSCGVNVPCFANPDFSFNQNVCNPKQVNFKNETANTFSVSWDFGNNTTDTAKTPIVTYTSYGNYNVKLVVTNTAGCRDSITKNITVNIQPIDGLIKNTDTTICLGASFKLSVIDSSLGFCWNATSGSINSSLASQTVAPANNTIYYYNTKTTSNNLVVNGDFENGNTGFTSDYIYQPPPRTSQLQYYVGTNPNVWFNPFVACTDHTTGTGNMMMFDGSATANKAMWKQTVVVQKNTDYLFSGWVQSTVAQNAAQIVLNINGNKVGTTTTAILTACNWKQFSATWNSGNNTFADLSILDSNLIVQGNDFAIDDISFAQVIIKTDSIKVDVVNCPINPVCTGVVELHGSDRVSLPTPYNSYYASTGFTWETWFNSSYYDNNSNSIDPRNKLIASIDAIPAEDILIGFGWSVGAKKSELCFVVDGKEPNIISIANRDNNPCVYKPIGGFVPNTWYHVAGVRDYANNQTKLYVNGQLVDTKTNNRPAQTRNIATFFGNFIPGLDSGFAGKMDEVRIWNTVRTATEIQSNYNKCLQGNEAGLVAYYHSNEKAGNILHDVTARGNNATLGTGVTFNKNDNAPIVNPCLLSTRNSDSIKTIVQGQSIWGYTTSGNYRDTFVNSLGCDSFRILHLTVTSNVAAAFTTPDTVCVNTPITINNTSTGATTYNWNFCSPDQNSNVIGVNLGSLGGNFSSPVFMDYALDNGNYYGFVINYAPSGLVRLDFGNSLLNTPTSVFIGNPSGLLPTTNGAEDIKLIKQNGKWNAFIVGGSPTLSGSLAKLVKLDFGATITNTNPTATDWGNIGNMEQAHQLYMWQENNVWYGLVFNAGTNTITRINFTNDFNNIPTAVNLGNIGSLTYPSNFCVIKDNGIFRIFVTNTKSNTISRLDFGNSLLNTPTGINLGNISNLLSYPRGIILKNECDGIYGYILNQITNDIIKISMASYTSTPTGISLGNISSLNNPVSFSKEFKIGTDIYSFVPNAGSNTLSLLKFSGCNNSSIPNSTAATPPAISYNAVGTYNINLIVDEGLPTQSTFCKKIVVVLPKKDSINYTICQGQSYQGYSVAGIYRDTFSTITCDSIRILNLKVLLASLTTLDTIPPSCDSVTYNANVYFTNTLVTTTIKNYLGCDSIIQQHQIIVNENKRDTIKVSICNGQSYLGYNISGVFKIDSVKLSTGCDSVTMLKLSVDKYIKDSLKASICVGEKFGKYQYAGTYYDTIISLNNCDTIRTIVLTVNALPKPQLIGNNSICVGDSLQLYPGLFKKYLWSNGTTASTITIKNIGTYSVQVTDSFGCKASDTFKLVGLYNLPNNFLPNPYTACLGETFVLPNALHFTNFNWNTGETTATINLNGLNYYALKVRDINTCVGNDTMKVVYLSTSKLLFTNAFSPNGDNINDVFRPIDAVCVNGFSIKIFSRWGQLVYQSSNPANGWNGDYLNQLGKPLPVGVYYFIVNYKNVNGLDNRQTGSITLLR